MTAYILPNEILVDVFKNNKTYDSLNFGNRRTFLFNLSTKGNSKKDPYKLKELAKKILKILQNQG